MPWVSSETTWHCNALDYITKMGDSPVFSDQLYQSWTQKHTLKIDCHPLCGLNIALSEHRDKFAWQTARCWNTKSVTRRMQQTVLIASRMISAHSCKTTKKLDSCCMKADCLVGKACLFLSSFKPQDEKCVQRAGAHRGVCSRSNLWLQHYAHILVLHITEPQCVTKVANFWMWLC